MIRLAFSIFTIVVFSLPFITVFNFKIGKALPLSYILMTLVMYICALINNFSLYKYIIVGLEIIIVIYILINIKKYKDRIINNLFRVSLLIFVIFYLYLFFALKEKMFIHIDEYYYWGKLVRESIINNSLFSNNNTVKIGTYPPFFPLLEIVFCKIFGNINNIEGYSIFAVSSFSISLFMCILDKFRFEKKDLLKIFVSTIIIIASSLFVSSNLDVRSWNQYNTILLDWPLGFLLFYCMYLSFNSDSSIYDSINIGLCCTALILSKQVSLPLCLLVIMVYFFVLLYKKKVTKNIFIPIAMAIGIYAIWQIKTGLYNDSLPISASLSAVSNATSIIDGDYSLIVIKKFISAFFTRPINLHPFEISYFAIIIALLLVMIFIGIVKKDKTYFIVGPFYFLGGIGYALMILFTYIAVFPERDGLSLVCFGRYMQTYSLASLLLVFYSIINIIKSTKCYLLMLLVMCLFAEPTSIKDLKIQKREENEYYDFRNTVFNFYNYTYDFGKVTILNSYDQTGIHIINYVNDINVKNTNEFNTFAYNDNPDEFEKIVKDSRYLIVIDCSDSFWEKGSHFFQDNLILNQSIYYVDFDESGNLILMRL